MVNVARDGIPDLGLVESLKAIVSSAILLKDLISLYFLSLFSNVCGFCSMELLLSNWFPTFAPFFDF